jgi:putative endonuclease
MYVVCTPCAFHPGAQFSVCMLAFCQTPGAAATNYYWGRLQRPVSDKFLGKRTRQPSKAVFLLLVPHHPASAGLMHGREKSYTFSMKQESKEIGSSGEKIAADYLLRNGYEILETNFQNNIGYRVGEIDIIAREKATREIAFVEVKARRRGSWDSENPELAITRAKYKKLTRIISRYLHQNKIEDVPHRLDAIAIEMDMVTRKAKLRHLKYIYY